MPDARAVRDARAAARSPSSPGGPTASTVRDFVAGPRRSGLARGQQPRVREPPRSGRLDRGDARRAAMAEPWFDPSLFVLAFDARRARRLQLVQVPPADRRRARARRDLRHRRRPASARASGSAGRSRSKGCARLRRPRPRDRLAVHRGRQHACAEAVPQPRLHRAPDRPRLRARRRSGMTSLMHRYLATRDDIRDAARGARRTALSRRPGVRRAVDATPSARSAHERRQGAARRARGGRCRSRSTPVTVQRGDEGMTVKWLWQRRRRRAGRDRADALPRPGDRLHLVAGRMRDGLHVLRDRSGRVRAPPRRRRDLRAGPPRAARLAATRRQRRLHGHGRTARQRRSGARVVDAPAPRRRVLGPPPHGLDGRRRARDAPPARVPAAGDARGVAARARRRAAGPSSCR